MRVLKAAGEMPAAGAVTWEGIDVGAVGGPRYCTARAGVHGKGFHGELVEGWEAGCVKEDSAARVGGVLGRWGMVWVGVFRR
jgi:hypothetical protein